MLLINFGKLKSLINLNNVTRTCKINHSNAGWEYITMSHEDDEVTGWNIRGGQCLLIHQHSFIFYNCQQFDPAHSLVPLSSSISGNMYPLFPCSHTQTQPLKQIAIPTHKSTDSCTGWWVMVTEKKQKQEYKHDR